MYGVICIYRAYPWEVLHNTVQRSLEALEQGHRSLRVHYYYRSLVAILFFLFYFIYFILLLFCFVCMLWTILLLTHSSHNHDLYFCLGTKCFVPNARRNKRGRRRKGTVLWCIIYMLFWM